MVDYYKLNPQDFENPLHNLKDITIEKYMKRPKLYGAAGIVFYLSNKSCDIIIRHMKNIEFNIFHYDAFTDSYPYTIEDCGVSFIMYMNDINFIHNPNFWDTKFAICKHTNKYK